MTALDYDLCVIGAGLIGAAAARHTSARSGVKVCLIGPDEPETRDLNDPRDIFGAHYDEGRITRAISTSRIWTKLAVQSINRYRELENQSGSPFYNEVGCLMAGSESFFRDVEKVVKGENIQTKSMEPSELKSTFPYMKFSDECHGIYEAGRAGYISPRKLIVAQKTMAVKQGCALINDVVRKVTRKTDDSGNYVMLVETEKGQTILCKSVLVSTGAFTSFRNLLPVSLDVSLTPIAVAKVEVTKYVADSLRKMPSVFYVGQGHPDWYTDNNCFNKKDRGFYMLPPVLYPNGKYYVKLGLNHEFTRNLRVNTKEEAKRWFVQGNHEIAEKTKRLLVSIFKDLPIESWHGDYCIVVETPTVLPYIDKIHSQLGVATGGNGFAAKSSDEIGRLAADLMFDEWNSDIPRDVFSVRYKNDGQSNL